MYMNYCECSFDLQLLSQCGITEKCLSRSVSHIHLHVAGTLISKQATSKWEDTFFKRSRHEIKPRFSWGTFPGGVIPMTEEMVLSWLSCHVLGGIGSVQLPVGLVSVYCDWVILSKPATNKHAASCLNSEQAHFRLNLLILSSVYSSFASMTFRQRPPSWVQKVGDHSSVESNLWLALVLTWLPTQMLGVVWSLLGWLDWSQYTLTRWDGKFYLELLFQCTAVHLPLNRATQLLVALGSLRVPAITAGQCAGR